MTDPRHNQRDVFPPTGTAITAKSWLTEAPMRMLMNNLHPDVAENPHDLVVYGGIGRAARTWKDFDHIVDSLNVPLAKLPERIAELERYRDKPVVLVCKFGQSASGASKTLKEKGFTKVFKLGGGISEWQGSQLPLVRS